ncbi:MAG: hypothetical protein ACLUOF_05540 [Ruminococcus sp.]
MRRLYRGDCRSGDRPARSFFGSSSKSVVKDYYKAIENCDAKI